MNIVLLMNNDIASNLALNLLLPSLKQYNLSVFLSSNVGGKKVKPAALKELAQFEQHDVFKSLQKIENVKYQLKLFSEIAAKNSIRIETLNEINTANGIDKISALAPDLIISIRYGVILRKPVIDCAKHGVINLHSGSLPDYRGVMATFWAMFSSEKTLSATLHFITDNTIDTGGVIAKTRFAVQPNKSYLWHVLSLYVDGCQLIESVVNQVRNNERIDTYQQADTGQYFSFPTTEQIAEFVEQYGALYQHDEVIRLLLKATLKIAPKTI